MMFISRFNKLIRNKILWSLFAFIVVISFVAWTTQTSGQRTQEDSAGKLYGKPVTAEQFRREYFNTYLSMSLMFGRPLTSTRQLNDLMRKLTWRKLVVLHMAKKLGLSVMADEVANTIEQQPYFLEKGQFNQDRYQAFVQTFLSKIGASEAQFEEHVREELLINKVRMLISQAVWISPLEIAQVFSQVYDKFIVSYVYLEKDDLRPKTKVSEADARKYFEGHREDFKIPEMVRVKYVAFPFKQFISEEILTTNALRSYYDENIEQFSVKTTNGWVPIPYEKAENQIREKLVWENAVNAAGEKALDFEISLAPDRSGNAPAFEEAAHVIKVNIATSSFFAAKTKAPEMEAGLDLNQAAFNLRPTPDDYFSHPIKGSNAYYIIALDKRQDARLPEYEEVKKDVFSEAMEKAVEEKVDKLISEMRTSAETALKTGRSFHTALKRYGFDVMTTEEFSAKSGFPVEDEEIALAMLKTIVALNTGELSAVIPMKNGAALAYIDSRKPADQTVFKSIRNELELFIKRRRMETVFYEWQEYLLKEARFEEFARQKPAQTAPEEEEETEDETDI
jgi:hypothetical protein